MGVTWMSDGYSHRVQGALDDLGIDPSILSGEELAVHLERRVQETLDEILASRVWAVLSDPETDIQTVMSILLEIYLEIVMYQPDSIEAAIASIGQMPRSMSPALVEDMLHHQVEEFDHGEMALRDFVGLGGSEAFARARTQSPSAFAIAGIWRNITHKRDPFLYLGAVCLFDGLTPIATDIVMKMIAARGQMTAGLEFVSHHATADVEHTAQVRALIRLALFGLVE